MHGQIAKNSDVAVGMTLTFLPTPYVKKVSFAYLYA